MRDERQTRNGMRTRAENLQSQHRTTEIRKREKNEERIMAQEQTAR
jgi:hypothetical protein